MPWSVKFFWSLWAPASELVRVVRRTFWPDAAKNDSGENWHLESRSGFFFPHPPPQAKMDAIRWAKTKWLHGQNGEERKRGHHNFLTIQCNGSPFNRHFSREYCQLKIAMKEDIKLHVIEQSMSDFVLFFEMSKLIQIFPGDSVNFRGSQFS